MIKNQVRICLKCDYDGRVVLESWSGPARWRFVCNKCNHIIYGLKDARTVKVIENKNCKICSAWLIHAQFKDSELTGCIFCDKALLGYLSEKSLVQGKNQNNNPKNRQYQPNAGRQSNDNKVGNIRDESDDNHFNPRAQSRGNARPNTGNLNNFQENAGDSNGFSNSRGRGRGSSRGRGGSRGRGAPRGRGGSRGRGRGRGGSRGDFNSNNQDLESQFKTLSYADFIKF